VVPPTPWPVIRPLSVVEPLQTAGLGDVDTVIALGLRSVVKVRSRPRATPAAFVATTRKW
jgi:hypothetical protein